nr:hypothetical protein [Tanacetum cinerariifolium]
MVFLKKNKPKNVKHVDGVTLSKPKPNFYYRKVEHGEALKTKDNNIHPEVTKTDTSTGVPKPSSPTIKNSFSLLSVEDQEDTYGELNDQLKDPSTILNESDNEEEEEMILEGPNGKRNVETASKGASTPIEVVSHVYTAGSSKLDIAMREFKECVDEIEVMDVQSSGL